MRKVARPTRQDQASLISKIGELCDATSQETEAVADAYQVTLPSGFTPVRTLDLTASPSAASVAAVLATFLLDLHNRGINNKATNV